MNNTKYKPGHVFSFLGTQVTLLKRFNTKDKNQRATFRCYCAEIFTTWLASVANGRVRSCGCLRKKTAPKNARKITDDPQRMEKTKHLMMFNIAKLGARSRQLEFTITREHVIVLMTSPCFYCNTPPFNKFDKRYNDKGRTRITFLYSGIDRLDSSRGYTPNNVVSCCKHCNLAKNSMSILEFKEWIKKVYDCWGKHSLST